MFSLGGCFSKRAKEVERTLQREGNTAPPDEALTTCIFCNVSKENDFNVVWEDEKFVAFRDYKPAAKHHMQVVPKRHIRSVRALKKNDVKMVETMRDIGHRMLDSLDVPLEMRRLGFHIPPYNSVNHLHLHVQALPYKTGRSLKYPIREGYGQRFKGFSWFVEVEQALKILADGRKIGALPC